MTKTRIKQPRPERLRASPTFSLNLTYDGRSYVAKDVEPYTQYWLDERYRVLLGMFSARRGATVDEAMAGYLRTVGTKGSDAERRRLKRAIDDMRAAGVIMSAQDDTSRYTGRIAEAYVAHRPFPREITEVMIAAAGVQASTKVLDLAGGPGDLALQLAGVSHRVSLMELSGGFLAAARARAKGLGLNLDLVRDSCNRLLYHDDRYDVVTISQALHWLDDVMVCRGLCRCLNEGGSFFVVQAAFDVSERHPLNYLFGARSILGPRPAQSFAVQAAALFERLGLLFEALDAPLVQRVDPTQQGGDGAAKRIVPKGVRLFRQLRPMGLGFARAFLTPQHIEVTGQAPEVFWKEIEERCAAASPDELLGTFDWALLHFRRDGRPRAVPASAWRRATRIGYEGSVA